MRTLINFLLIIILSLSISCNGQQLKKEDTKIEKAKWFFYCYSSNLNLYKGNVELSTLESEIKSIGIRNIAKDTVSYLFRFIHQNDTLAFCTTKPLEIVGVTLIKDSFFLPIYNHLGIPDDPTTEIQILNLMQSSKDKFDETIKNKSNLCNWLKLNYSKYK